jgi:hypothetical protein
MREHQAFILVLSFVFVSVAVFAGFQLYSSYELDANKGSIINTLTTLAEDAHAFRTRPVSVWEAAVVPTRGTASRSNSSARRTDFHTERAGSHLPLPELSRPLNGRIVAGRR